MATIAGNGPPSILMATPPLIPQSTTRGSNSFKLPSFSTHNVTQLLKYRKEGEGEEDHKKAEKEIKSLVKKLKKKENLHELERALSSGGDIPTRCVTLPRQLDGKDGASAQRLPHVVYCRIWRWPDLQSHHELKPADVCQYSYYNRKSEEVCINPYHYIRIVAPPIMPVLVPNRPTQQPLYHEPQSTGLPQNIDCPLSSDPLPAEETPPPAYSEVPPVDSPADPQSVYSGVGSPIMSPLSAASNTSVNPIGSPAQSDYHPITYTEPAYWCSISYHELGTKVGETFQAIRPSIIVDGGTDPGTTDRFCLGKMCNVNRDNITIQARKHIGQGIKLMYIGGEVHLECLGKNAVFVQAPNANLRNRWESATVVKVPQGCLLDLFNSQDFAKRLADAVHLGYEAVTQLQKQCTIRMSFIKGWGADYRRSQITSTPCWIEVNIHGPMQWLDKVQTHMGGPNGIIHSDT
ncbi:PREDICTED: mothers against decapentaplegic homolog 3-like isoform X2 [Amphimedon queenslandica]|uniref:Mothers against decapentaplegic homolog n=1 Tax=Amphimedon queenslandica TaxID=400682 RepID=A0AAN0IXM0_AMPQE|nr:PREDICTED: mothers against decapentaplegic homolog 3-like isoform X2 [Amphimedon queenslandica]|eukprot:XP_019849198.1 PREDICTED: mothers against decapentaplegic homolog 3-like isoform X2 [Amphimedon queenslandica]